MVPASEINVSEMRVESDSVIERVLQVILSIRQLIELIANLSEINRVEIDKCYVQAN